MEEEKETKNRNAYLAVVIVECRGDGGKFSLKIGGHIKL